MDSIPRDTSRRDSSRRDTSRRQALSHLTQFVGGTLLLGQLEEGSLAQPPKQRIKIGQIGTQHPHASKINVYRQSPDYEVVGIVESNVQARQQAEQLPHFQGLPWLSEQELLNTPGLQAVLVETHMRDSLAVAQRAVDAGLHIHLDKPAGNDLPAFQKVIADARRQHLLVQMGYMYRYNPAVLLLREFLKDGWLGEVLQVHAAIGKFIAPAERKELAEFPGGIMFELGCHLIDLVIAIIGPGSFNVALKQRLGADGLCDNAHTVFQKERLLATVTINALEIEGGARRHLTVVGTRGTFHIQPLDNPVATISLDQPRGEYKKGVQTQSFPKFTRYVADAADMARILRHEKATDYSYEHDLEVQRCVLVV